MKKNIDLARAWRDEDYYLSLNEEERASLPAHPSGLAEVEDGDLTEVVGGTSWFSCGTSAICSPCPPNACN